MKKLILKDKLIYYKNEGESISRFFLKQRVDSSKGMYFDILSKQVGEKRAKEIIKISKDPLANIKK
jgi:hypothetical protein